MHVSEGMPPAQVVRHSTITRGAEAVALSISERDGIPGTGNVVTATTNRTMVPTRSRPLPRRVLGTAVGAAKGCGSPSCVLIARCQPSYAVEWASRPASAGGRISHESSRRIGSRAGRRLPILPGARAGFQQYIADTAARSGTGVRPA